MTTRRKMLAGLGAAALVPLASKAAVDALLVPREKLYTTLAETGPTKIVAVLDMELNVSYIYEQLSNGELVKLREYTAYELKIYDPPLKCCHGIWGR